MSIRSLRSLRRKWTRESRAANATSWQRGRLATPSLFRNLQVRSLRRTYARTKLLPGNAALCTPTLYTPSTTKITDEKAPHMHSNAAINLMASAVTDCEPCRVRPNPLPARPRLAQHSLVPLSVEYSRRSFIILKCTDVYRLWAKMSPSPAGDDDDDNHISSHFLLVKPSPSTLSTELLLFSNKVLQKEIIRVNKTWIGHIRK
jgi:hypothetical protein